VWVHDANVTIKQVECPPAISESVYVFDEMNLMELIWTRQWLENHTDGQKYWLPTRNCRTFALSAAAARNPILSKLLSMAIDFISPIELIAGPLLDHFPSNPTLLRPLHERLPHRPLGYGPFG